MKKDSKKSKEIKKVSKKSEKMTENEISFWGLQKTKWMTCPWGKIICWGLVVAYWAAVVWVALRADTERRIIRAQIFSMFIYPAICIFVMPYIRNGKFSRKKIYDYFSSAKLFVHITHGFIFPSIAVLLSVAFDEGKIKEIGKDTIILSSIYALAYICQTSMFKALLPDKDQKPEG